ncbi:hypothetical protein KAJ83_05805 [Marivibrio halodurans]|uniref:DUF6538 domain-containing protein n=1 Tax=Marivibrio halodurans TaxID=2039722 RepID=A0A8J7S0Q1_9PROT|nr:DUF6538 domain-containing protein [Marivibrio halodurans]MBP5856513.1 hypothetical protein [Marivibrio halodurans]
MRGLTKRGNTFWFRRGVPPGLRASIGAREITQPLKTTDKKVAERCCAEAWLASEERLDEARLAAKRSAIGQEDELLEDWLMGHVSRWWEEHIGTFDPDHGSPEVRGHD